MKKFIAIVALLYAVMFSSTASAADWVWIYSDDDCTVYVDNNSIRRDYSYSGYVFRAFVKWVYSDAGRKKEINKWYRLKGDSLSRKINNLSHNVELRYFKDNNGIKYSDVLESIYYANDGSTIPEISFSYSYHQWSLLPPDSIGEWLYFMIKSRIPN